MLFHRMKQDDTIEIVFLRNKFRHETQNSAPNPSSMALAPLTRNDVLKRINEERKAFIRQNEVIFGKHLFAGTNDRLHQLFQTFHHERNLHPRQLGKIFAKTLDEGKEGSKKRREGGRKERGKKEGKGKKDGRKDRREGGSKDRREGRKERRKERMEGRQDESKEGRKEGK